MVFAQMVAAGTTADMGHQHDNLAAEEDGDIVDSYDGDLGGGCD